MTETKPVVHILHGNNEQAIVALLAKMTAHFSDPTTAELNISRLDGRTHSEAELVTAATAMPFLADHRLVIFQNPLARLASKDGQARFCHVLDSLPPTTLLVLVIPDTPERRTNWTVLKDSHWLRKWADQAGQRARVQACALPAPAEMPGWILKHAKEMGGQFTPAAAQVLANHIGSDTRLAMLEVEKLLLFVDFARPVEADDVEQLTAAGSQANIFDMVDNLAAGNVPPALRQLHRLLETSDPLSLWGMIVRQFRLLLITREILDEGGGSPQVQTALHQIPFVADKLTHQAQRFTLPELERIYHRLLEMDEAMKTSAMSNELALDTFFASMGR